MTDWPFTPFELTAGLRRYLADPSLQVLEAVEEPLALRLNSTPTRGIGVDVERCGHCEHYSYMVTRPRPVRYGLPGGGLREAGFYRNITLPLTFALPELVAADPRGAWLILEPYPPYFAPEQWTATEYRQAVLNLAHFHDQFWRLDEDLAVYPWVGFPLARDFETVCLAAAQSVEKIIHIGMPAALCGSVDYMTMVARLITQADAIAQTLKRAPQTLLHGDYWPGNISVDEDQRYVVYDWQTVGVGPGVLDLLVFINKSQLYYSPLPVEPEELISLYRYVLANQVGFMSSNEEWQRVWDYALMWRFLQEKVIAWSDPHEAWVGEDEALLKKLWLDPVTEAADRWLDKYILI